MKLAEPDVSASTPARLIARKYENGAENRPVFIFMKLQPYV